MKDALTQTRDQLARDLADVDRLLKQRTEAAALRRHLNKQIENLETERAARAARIEMIDSELADLRQRLVQATPDPHPQ